jgi:hypothetical protein
MIKSRQLWRFVLNHLGISEIVSEIKIILNRWEGGEIMLTTGCKYREL